LASAGLLAGQNLAQGGGHAENQGRRWHESHEANILIRLWFH
jgi:hypothetical protein